MLQASAAASASSVNKHNLQSYIRILLGNLGKYDNKIFILYIYVTLPCPWKNPCPVFYMPQWCWYQKMLGGPISRGCCSQGLLPESLIYLHLPASPPSPGYQQTAPTAGCGNTAASPLSATTSPPCALTHSCEYSWK